MARRKDKTIGEKMDSKERIMEMTKRIKHTTWAHGDDSWNVMCARQTYDLSHACVRVISCATLRKCDVWGVLFTPPVGCRRLLSAVNGLTTTKKNLAKCHFWAALWRNCTTGLPVSSCCSLHELSCYCHELHQESFHCHQDVLDEEDEGCHCWYCQEGIGESRSSPDSRCRRCNFVNASLKSERSFIGSLRPNVLGEIFLRVLVHLDAYFFSSINAE